MKACHACGAEWAAKESPGFSAECPRCGAYLHCCLNCKFHAPGAHYDCREPAAELVSDKEKRNTCELFLFAERSGKPDPSNPADKAAVARARLAKLFGEQK